MAEKLGCVFGVDSEGRILWDYSGTMQVWYCVTAKFTDVAVRDEYLHWLEDGHIAAVVKGGALNAMAVVLEGEDFRVLTQYVFPSSADFDLYVREHAPTLRADGAKRFPAGRGVSFERSQGTVALSVGEGR